MNPAALYLALILSCHSLLYRDVDSREAK